MVLLDLEGAPEVKFGYRDALAVRIAGQDIWVKPDAGVDPTLEAAYNFEEEYGTLVFQDYSSKGRDITIPVADKRTESFANNGEHAAARGTVFAGGSSGVAVAPYNAMASRTMMGWVAYYNLTGTWMMRWQSQSIDSGVFGLYFLDETVRARVRKGGTAYNAQASGSRVVNQWNHLAQTYDAVTGLNCLYINGALAGSMTVPGGGTPDAADFIDVASDGAAPYESSNGIAIDDPRIYSRALSAAEVLADMGTPIG